MLKQGDRHVMITLWLLLRKFYGNVWNNFFLNIRKHFFVEVSSKNQLKEHKVL